MWNRLSTVTDPDSNVATYTYDGADRVTQVKIEDDITSVIIKMQE